MPAISAVKVAKVYVVEVYDDCDFGSVAEHFACLTYSGACTEGQARAAKRNGEEPDPMLKGWSYRVLELPLVA